MHILFVGRKNGTAPYYKELLKFLNTQHSLYIMGAIYPLAILNIRHVFSWNCSSIVDKQIHGKVNKRPILKKYKTLIELYKIKIHLTERLRFIKYLSLFKSIKPDIICIWNGGKLPNETVVFAAKHLGIKVIFFELGVMAKTITLDHSGVNGQNSLPRNPEFYLKYSFPNIPTPPPKPSIRKPTSKRVTQEAIELPKEFIFIPFQVPHDTQIINNSPWIKSMEELFQEVTSAFLEGSNNNLYLVFKEHPSWAGNFDQFYDKYDKVVFANGNSTPDLIEKSRAIITINSSVGIESLSLTKKVITLGNAFYNIEGLTINCQNRKGLTMAINNIENWEINEPLRKKFLDYLYNIYCIPERDFSDPIKAIIHAEAVKKRILGIDDLAKSIENNIYT